MAKTAEVYKLMAGALDQMPAERAVLGLFCDLTLAAGVAPASGTSAAGRDGTSPSWQIGPVPRGIGLSPERSAWPGRDYPGFDFSVADLRHLRFEAASMADVICWCSLMYLAPGQRPAALSELTRVVQPGRPSDDRLQGR